MIVKKVFECTTRNVDGVILAIADEIKAGYSVDQISTEPVKLSARPEGYPTFTVTMVRRDAR